MTPSSPPPSSVPPGPPPPAPGSLDDPAESAELLTYLTALSAWRDKLRVALDDVESRARGGVLAADVTLAYALWQSITERVDELIRVWDSGRVRRREREALTALIWARLDDQPGGLPINLTEACVLGEALLSRLAQRLQDDLVAGSGITGLVAPVRASLARSRRQLADSGQSDDPVTRIEADLDRLLSTETDPAAARFAFTTIDAAASTLERDLIVAGATRSGLSRLHAQLDARRTAALARADQVRRIAATCAAAVRRPPVLAVPDPARLGPVPDQTADWAATRTALDAYAARLSRVEAALDAASQRYAAPLAELAELRGLLDAYRVKAGRSADGTDDDLQKAYTHTLAVLRAEPCDLEEARALVQSYRSAVGIREDAVTGLRPVTAPPKAR
ncbi:MAG TPA: hypothetical protein VNB94_07280 [Mycobacteriales bacterium]|nr:hypothetical protein [Mycobacteriales bacterium]